MPDLAAAYHDARLAMAELARDVKDRAGATMVPACPDWNSLQNSLCWWCCRRSSTPRR